MVAELSDIWKTWVLWVLISLRGLDSQGFASSVHGTGTIGHLSIFPESIWRRSLCVSNNALTAHMNLTSMNLSKSFFILFIFVDFATS